VATSGSGPGTIYECFLDNAPPSEKMETEEVTEEKEELFR
jgi:hypothetical protein